MVKAPIDRTRAARAVVASLRSGSIPTDTFVRKTCSHIALVVTALKSRGRVYDATLEDPITSTTFIVDHVHATWTRHVAPILGNHLRASAATYDAVMATDPSHIITTTLPGLSPMKLRLRAVVDNDGSPATHDPPAEAGAVTMFRCLTCQVMYRSPVNAARCVGTHPSPGSRQTRRAYDAAAVAAFWDGLSPGARLDLVKPNPKFSSTMSFLTMSGAELLDAMDALTCENLLLMVLHREPYKIPEDAMDAEDHRAHMAFAVIDIVIQAMKDDAAAKERALLEELDADAIREAEREAGRQAKLQTRRAAREARRRRATMDRLVHDDAFFRSFLPGCAHWDMDEEDEGSTGE